MTTADLVRVTTSLIDAKNIPTYARVRGEIFGDVRPALYSMCHGKLFGSGLGRSRHPYRPRQPSALVWGIAAGSTHVGLLSIFVQSG
jgi:hypothetical protein